MFRNLNGVNPENEKENTSQKNPNLLDRNMNNNNLQITSRNTTLEVAYHRREMGGNSDGSARP